MLPSALLPIVKRQIRSGLSWISEMCAITFTTLLRPLPSFLNLNGHPYTHASWYINSFTVIFQMIKILKAILAYLRKSTYAKAHLCMQFKEGDDGKHIDMLQKIGKTHFGTHWSGANSLEKSLPQAWNLMQSSTIKIKVCTLFIIPLFFQSSLLHRAKKCITYLPIVYLRIITT